MTFENLRASKRPGAQCRESFLCGSSGPAWQPSSRPRRELLRTSRALLSLLLSSSIRVHVLYAHDLQRRPVTGFLLVKSDTKEKAPSLTTTHRHCVVVDRLVAMDWTSPLEAPGVVTEYTYVPEANARLPCLSELGKKAYTTDAGGTS